jgi:hypothetical protein
MLLDDASGVEAVYFVEAPPQPNDALLYFFRRCSRWRL